MGVSEYVILQLVKLWESYGIMNEPRETIFLQCFDQSESTSQALIGDSL